MKLGLAVLVLFCASMAFAQGIRYDNFVQLPGGGVVANPTVAVCSAGANTTTTPCTPLASIYTNQALTTPATNPMTGDQYGNYGFWAAPGQYVVQVYKAGISTQVFNVFLPCGPGASCTAGSVTAAVTDKGGQVFNVKAYGAKGDGTTDDTAAIQATIVAAQPGGTVLVPPGQYKLTSGLSITTGERFECVPGGSTSLVYAPVSGAVITISYGGNNVGGIFGCAFPGGASNTGDAIDIGTASVGAFAPVIENVSIGVQSVSGFATGININPNNVSSDVQNVRIVNPIIRHTNIGIHIYAAEQTSITSGVIAESATGLKTEQFASDVAITGTSFDTNTTYGIDNEGETAITLNGVHFENNTAAYTDYVFQGGAFANSVTMNGGMLLEDRTTGTQADFVKVNCQFCTFNAFGTYLWSRGATITQAVNLANTGASANLQFYNSTPLSFTNEWSITSGSPSFSHVTDFPIANSGATGLLNSDNQSLYVQNGSIITDGVFQLGTPTSGTSWGRGTSAPTGACNTGSIFSNINGVVNTSLYYCQNGAWVSSAASGANGISAKTVTLAAGTATWTFATPYASAPTCTASDNTAANAVRVEPPLTTSVKIDGTTTDSVSIICTPAAN